MKPNGLSDQLSRGKMFLKKHGVESYMLDAGLLLAEAAGVTRERVLTDGGVLTDEQTERYGGFLNRRADGEPVQYILGRCEFMSLPFCVCPDVLIPRPDTETLAEAVINEAKKTNASRTPFRLLDMCAGSGCVAVSAAYYAQASVTAADISAKALEVAEKNARLNGVRHKIEFTESDLFENIRTKGFDAIVSNPPYIKSSEMASLPKSVKNFEPEIALNGGVDGLTFYEKIAEDCRSFLNLGASVLFEVGFDMADAVSEILKRNGFTDISVIRDLAGKDRVARAKFTR